MIMKIIIMFSFLIYSVLFSASLSISERELLNSYLSVEPDPREKPVSKPVRQRFDLDISMYSHFRSDINFMPETDDFIADPYNEADKKASALKSDFYGRFTAVHPFMIFNLKNRFQATAFQRYSAENRWWNDFEGDLGFYDKQWKFVFTPGFLYEEYYKGQLFSREKYSGRVEFRHFGLEGHLYLHNFYYLDDRDAEETGFEPYFFWKSDRGSFRFSIRNENRSSRKDCYSYTGLIGEIEAERRWHSWKISAKASSRSRDYEKPVTGNVAREDTASNLFFKLTKKLFSRNEFFISVNRENRSSSVSEYSFSDRVTEAGWTFIY